jgi:hypothetical protein
MPFSGIAAVPISMTIATKSAPSRNQVNGSQNESALADGNAYGSQQGASYNVNRLVIDWFCQAEC